MARQVTEDNIQCHYVRATPIICYQQLHYNGSLDKWIVQC